MVVAESRSHNINSTKCTLCFFFTMTITDLCYKVCGGEPYAILRVLFGILFDMSYKLN